MSDAIAEDDVVIDVETPEWAVPLLADARYKGAKGGRGSGKSHFFAELAVEEMVMYPWMNFVCIREMQRSLKYSAKKLVENKINAMGVRHLFDIQHNVIKRVGGTGLMIFEGMQDHTADSIKSLEGFHRAWVEEAQSLSARSIQLLRPTIREEGSQIWFSWNPDQPTDAVEQLLCGPDAPANAIVVHVNFCDNPFLPTTLRDEMEHDRAHNPDTFDHVWMGAHNKKTKAQVFAGKWRIDEFVPADDWDGPYCGLDFGFATDPTAGVILWIDNNRLYVEHDTSKIRLDIDDTPLHLKTALPGFERYTVRADSARPDSISYLQRHGFPRMVGAVKGKGSVEDGVTHIRSYTEVVIHRRCEATAQEFRLYSYKIDKRSGDILPELCDSYNHIIDSMRYALEPMIKNDDWMTKFKALAS